MCPAGPGDAVYDPGDLVRLEPGSSDLARRTFLKTLGASAALAAVSQFFPLSTATEVFAQGGAIEKKNLKVGFIPITCATPIIMAHPMGFYERQGLLTSVRTSGHQRRNDEVAATSACHAPDQGADSDHPDRIHPGEDEGDDRVRHRPADDPVDLAHPVTGDGDPDCRRDPVHPDEHREDDGVPRPIRRNRVRDDHGRDP
jgi:hypothetical protein